MIPRDVPYLIGALEDPHHLPDVEAGRNNPQRSCQFAVGDAVKLKDVFTWAHAAVPLAAGERRKLGEPFDGPLNGSIASRSRPHARRTQYPDVYQLDSAAMHIMGPR